MTNPAPLPHIGLVLAISDDALPGAFVITGYSQTGLLVGKKLVSAAGSFALTGQDATLTEATPTAIAAAPIPPLSFLDLFNAAAQVIVAESGSFSVSGSSTLTKGRALTAEAGSFVGSFAPAERDMEVNGDAATFNWYGQSAAVIATRKLSCEYGAFTLTGSASGGVYEQPGAKSLICDAGSFAISASSVLKSFSMVGSPGSFVVTSVSIDMSGPVWDSVSDSSGTWVYITPAGGTWTDVDPDA